MESADSTELFIALPTQFIEIPNGVVLKRGCTEFRITGDRAAEIVHCLLAAAAHGPVSRKLLSENFAEPDRLAVEKLIEQLIVRRILVPRLASGEAYGNRVETSLEVFYWHFGQGIVENPPDTGSEQWVILGVNCISRQMIASLRASRIEGVQVVDYPLLRNVRLFDGEGVLLHGEWPVSCSLPIPYQDWIEKTSSHALDCVIATADFSASQALRDWNKFCVQQNRVFFPIMLENLIGRVGPIVIPGETACYECLQGRLNADSEHMDAKPVVEAAGFESQIFTGFHPAMASILGDIAVLELTRFYSDVLPKTKPGSMIEVNLLATKLTSRRVLKIPRCPICSPLNQRSSAAFKRSDLGSEERQRI